MAAANASRTVHAAGVSLQRLVDEVADLGEARDLREQTFGLSL